MRVSKYIRFKGAVYRLAALPMPKDISWGPDEWPSEAYMYDIGLVPPENPDTRRPFTKEEYYAIKSEIDALEGTGHDREALDLARRILPVKRWLQDNNPGAALAYRRRWNAETRKK